MTAEFSIAKLLDLEVFAMGGSRGRTQNDCRVLIESAGFELTKVAWTHESVSILEAVKSDRAVSFQKRRYASCPCQWVVFNSPALDILQSHLRRRRSRRQIHPTMLI